MSDFFAAIIFLLTLIYLSLDISGAGFRWISVGIAYTSPLLLVALFLLAISSIRSKNWIRVIVLTFCSLIWAPRYADIVNILPNKINSEHEQALSLLTYNVAAFSKDNNSDKDHVDLGKFINSDVADIKCLQEYWGPTSTEEIRNILGDKSSNKTGQYSYIADKSVVGPILLSRYPIIKTENLYLPFPTSYGNGMIFADILVEERIVRVYCIHIGSLYDLYVGAFMSGTFSPFKFIGLVKHFFESREAQAVALLSHVKKSPYPTIVCGDFNDTPFGDVYLALRKHLESTFKNGGVGFGGTSEKVPLKMARIDHVLYSDGLINISHKTFTDVTYSDHYPVLVQFGLE